MKDMNNKNISIEDVKSQLSEGLGMSDEVVHYVEEVVKNYNDTFSLPVEYEIKYNNFSTSVGLTSISKNDFEKNFSAMIDALVNMKIFNSSEILLAIMQITDYFSIKYSKKKKKKK